MSPVTAGAYPSAPNQPKNPDTRPLPAGWITEYDERHVQVPYYPIRSLSLFDRTPSTDSVSKQLQNLVRIAEDPIVDKGDFHCHLFRFYVDTNANPPTPSWVHPLGTTTKPVSSQVAAPTNTPSILTVNSGDPENPDKRPLPRGWTQQYDRTWVSFS